MSSKTSISTEEKALFEGIQTYVMFLGYPRSGHSIVGAFLDAHPDMIVANELDALAYVREGYSREEIFRMLLDKSSEFREAGNVWTGYSYQVPNQWQGRYRNLKVIGDKRGSNSARHLFEEPGLLDVVAGWVPNLKILHLTRNPYDNIATCVMRREQKRSVVFGDKDVRRKIGQHFRKAATIRELSESGKYDILHLRHEDFIERPAEELKKVCDFIGIEATEEYLNDCASIVFKKPHYSRHKMKQWNEDLLELVAEESAKYPFLDGYTFDD